tara:strand:- start:67 stop:738 length:672 start_codon:yes stop_codon:yes gene_type:complete
MSDKIECRLLKPFGSTIAKSSLPKELIEDFLKDLYDIRQNPDKAKQYAFDDKLAGTIYKQLLISPEVMLKWKQKYFDHIIKHYVESHYKNNKMARCVINSAWTNTQKKNDYNPLHTHTHFTNKALSPDLSCVGYLKLPKMKPHINAPKHHQVGGWIEFCEGSENIFNNANYLVEPMLADYYLFPANLKHFVYPFNSDDTTAERISFSFNTTIIFDEMTQNEQK